MALGRPGRRRQPVRASSLAPAAVLAPDECAALTDAVLRGDRQAPERLLAAAFEWANAVRLQCLILDRVLSGEVDIVASRDGAELTFRPHRAANVVPFTRPDRVPGNCG
jgi:hypothetical protein